VRGNPLTVWELGVRISIRAGAKLLKIKPDIDVQSDPG
jgi:hypothetical protein